MKTNIARRTVHLCLACTLALLTGCGGGSNGPTSPSQMMSNVTGTWDVIFEGTIVQRNDSGPVGAPQHDLWVYQFQQSGSSVTGDLIGNEGQPNEARIPMSGTVTGNAFTYRLNTTLDGCAVNFRGETTVSSAGDRFTGTQTQANCEGTAEGQVIGTKR